MQISDHIQLHFATNLDASIFYQSFLPEITSMPMKRSSWTMHPPEEQGTLIIEIEAQDAIAYRATINVIIQMAYIVEKTLQIVDLQGE